MRPEGPGSAANPLSNPTPLDKDSSQDTDTEKTRTGTHALPGLESQLPEAGSKRLASNKELPARKVARTDSATNWLQCDSAWVTERLEAHQPVDSGYSATLSPKPSSKNTQQPVSLSIDDEDYEDELLKSLPDLPDYKIKPRFFDQMGSVIPYSIPFTPPSQSLYTPPQPLFPPPAKRMKSSNGNDKKQTDIPVWPPKHVVRKQVARGQPTTYRTEFENWAATMSSTFNKPISARELWEISNYGPATAAGKYLDPQTLEKTSLSKQNDLLALLNKVRYRRIMLNKKQISLEFDDSATEKITTHSSSPLSPALSSSTDTGYSSETSSLSISSPLSIVSESGKKPAKSPRQKSVSSLKSSRAILTNPHKNCCFVNAVIHFLNATLATEELEALAGFHSRDISLRTGYPEVLTPLSKLIDQIKQFEKGSEGAHYQVTEALQHLITACRESEGFRHSIQFKTARLKKSVKQPPESQTLKLLEHNDASLFLMDIWLILTALLPSQAKLQIHTESRTILNGIEFVKKSLQAGESAPFLNLQLSREGSVQQSINDYFATMPPDKNNQVEWRASDDIRPAVSGERLPPGYYASSKINRLRLSGPLTRLNVRLELQLLEGNTQKKNHKACKKLIQQVFQPVSIPVEDPDTTEITQVDASPCCILLHTGTDLRSGHYVTLEKIPEGWLLIDDSEPATLLPNPMAFLTGSPRYDPYLISYDISNR
ncbi:hypothetical protein [Endozoicomonas lisbonensis]|uniref:USP domain-containing protein n=1 Tax=Endozoicomonas lisbonensis TaxID=3120522 RepID=A0ABV2SID0_9GAMM